MVGCSEISRLAGLRAADFKQFDFFNHLGMNPHIETLELGDSLNRRFKYVAVRLHPDKCGNNPPKDINFILLTSFVNAWKVADDVVKAIVIQDINTKAKAGWRSTWQMTDEPGKWTPIKWTAPPVAPGVHTPRTRSSANKDVVVDDSDVEEVVNPFGFRQSAGSWASTNNYHRKRAASPLQSQGQQKRQTHRADDISNNDANHAQDEASPQLTERRRRPYTLTNTRFPRFDPRTLTTDTTTNDARQRGQRSSAYPGTAGTTPQDSIPILSDDDEETTPPDDGGNAAPLLQVNRFQRHLARNRSMASARISFRYQFTDRELYNMGMRTRSRNTRISIAIGVIRQRNASQRIVFPEYIVTASIPKLGAKSYTTRVCQMAMNGDYLESYSGSRVSAFPRDEITTQGYQFAQFQSKNKAQALEKIKAIARQFGHHDNDDDDDDDVVEVDHGNVDDDFI